MTSNCRKAALGIIAALMMTTSAQAAELYTNLTADPAMIDPITYSELVAGDVIKNMYESFVEVTGDGTVVPALAESWEPLADNLGFRFHLRHGVKFHSGREFTAKDVKFTFEQLLLPDNKGGLNAPYLDVVVGADAMRDGTATELTGVKIIDDYTVEVAFTAPDVLFPIYPIYLFDSGVIEDSGPDWATKVSAGTGPFKFESWTRGQDVHVLAFDDYRKGAPAIDGVHFMVVPDSNTAMSMYETGELDVLIADAALIRRIRGDETLKSQAVVSAPAQVRYIAMNQDLYPPFANVKLREAVCTAFSQPDIVEGIYQGQGFPLYGAITPGVAGYNPDVPVIPYDPDHAAELMVEAGYPNGEGLPPLKFSDLESSKTRNLYLVSQFQEVLGMPVELEVLERGAMLSNMNAHQLPFYPWGWSADYPDGLNFLKDLWYSGSSYNKGYSNPEYDAIIEEAEVTADEQARYKLYKAAEKVLLDDWGMCPLPTSMQVSLVKPNVEGVELTPFRFLPFNNVTKAE